MGETVEALVDAGKASAGPPLGPALGPSGVNVKEVINQINSETKDMEGMRVPVKVKVGDDKSFTIEVGTPPASSLIKQILGIEKGSGEAGSVIAADLPLEKAIKVAKQKGPGLTGGDIKAMTSEILGVMTKPVEMCLFGNSVIQRETWIQDAPENMIS